MVWCVVGLVGVAARVGEVEYAIREVAALAAKLSKSGVKIIPLNIGDPVKFDFKTPTYIKEALVKAVLEDQNMYGPSEGLPELRKAISERLSGFGADIVEDDIIITNGISEGIQMLTGVLVEAGDEVLVPSPSYPSYNAYIRFYGGKAVSYRTVEEDGWAPDIEHLRSRVSKRTKAVLLINPNNPTGALYDAKTVKEVVQIAAENNLILIADEIYDEIIFEGSFTPAISLAKDVNFIGLNGFSKAHLMTGWRLGYIYLKDGESRLKEVKEGLLRLARVRLCPNTPVQKAAVAALRGSREHIQDMVKRLRERRDFSLKAIEEVELLSSTTPNGAFYLFPKINLKGTKWATDKEFVLDLLRETGVTVVHGSGFGEDYGSNHFRMVFLPPLDVLGEAFEKIKKFVKTHYRS
ncbi:MAG: aminotransferase class I/II-fold pyridoxal phosphate-dependent enzyme [Nitrososphaerales archaeon]